ncbi:hypothetical protein RirG_216980 [Rhizophagus irregularis DAOM 197198w]|uniref:Uncharacterized protein n=1 Tax=Rhizophagus irregularis (strain DAOM 197198w) TaxID=1432141 RepID=A0A015JN19_RHIIW|nr:hypothetical protein RirG_216980 [Rhizophagus irregularis DAOM 197198w]
MDKKRKIKLSYNVCKICNRICYTRHFQQDFKNWTSGNNDIDNFIQYTQLSAHNDVKKALEWIPYDRFHNIKYVEKDRYQANWNDGNIIDWDSKNKNWKREGQNIIVILKKLNTEDITLEFMNEIAIAYGITQNPETKDYMRVLSKKCKKCEYICFSIYFQQNFNNWTSCNEGVDKFIQNIQLSTHDNLKEALEWIPYDKFYNIKYIAENEYYEANWIDGNLYYWNENIQNWIRKNQNMIVMLKKLNNTNDITLEFVDEIVIAYGITQIPETKDYMMVLNEKCKKCNNICYSIHFQQNFNNWTSGNNDIDNFIQYTQLSAHNDVKKALEWIPYDQFYSIEYIEKDRYQASWNDGNIIDWDSKNKNWKREGKNMIVILKKLNNTKDITLGFANETAIAYGITQIPETKDYMKVLSKKCKKCDYICSSIYFQQNFNNWTSGNEGVDKFIQDIQLSTHDNLKNALEWISYDKFYDITYFVNDRYQANWIEGNIINWNESIQNWTRDQNTIVILKKLNNTKDITLEFVNEIAIAYGITQNPETKDYMMVLNEKCKKCNDKCYSIHFTHNFNNWTSGNEDVDKFIQDTQLSAHNDVKKALEWITYDKFYNINYIAANEYKANWIELDKK